MSAADHKARLKKLSTEELEMGLERGDYVGEAAREVKRILRDRHASPDRYSLRRALL